MPSGQAMSSSSVSSFRAFGPSSRRVHRVVELRVDLDQVAAKKLRRRLFVGGFC